jgi:hypothetical protein
MNKWNKSFLLRKRLAFPLLGQPIRSHLSPRWLLSIFWMSTPRGRAISILLLRVSKSLNRVLGTAY